ncbi:NADH-quinone oxidoreductase subunit I [Desulfurococcus amylolyticus]|uniref:NuoI NADH dehydrogenase I, subunit I n=1 Tax=Desulfurococcus amylolyticus (strain DSM 18924 / JCM 16383 / VKM B-2413 / 1221n) TaxID=490899 RepID=B8D598_DESA1|nr:NADH-quinone oxidoreductase subunit I [Desulfurococcus amylolyticus]ACL11279.1 NuoI NADH dehydrogenase I, subunit I [Desulfurococcus amylolyticus 1221n]
MVVASISNSLKYLLRKPYTRQVPRIDKPFKTPVTRGSHVLDMLKCTGCSMCQQVCPANAIDMVTADGDYPQNPRKRFPRIDLHKCTFCGLCVEYCPFNALSMTTATGYELFTVDKSTLLRQPIELKLLSNASITITKSYFTLPYSKSYQQGSGDKEVS